jgi:hypothetical protein
MTFFRRRVPQLAWALGAVWIFFTVCGWALRFGMGYRRGMDEAATHDGRGADHRIVGG